ncbi:OTU domain-containing protein OS=Streptomyces fumanus OX=67302 GN=GCM10018772_56770 PE=4 SV=1 [Streptomyces fumanus]
MLHAPGIRLLTFIGSNAGTGPGRPYRGSSAGVSVTVAGPVTDRAALSGGVGYARGAQSARTSAHAIAFGEEQYYFSPGDGGVHVTEHPGVLRARFSDGATPDLTAAVRVRFAVPDHRMLAAAEPDGPNPAPCDPRGGAAASRPWPRARTGRRRCCSPGEPSSNG